MFKPLLLVAIAMVAFAANSLLCRMALAHTSIDPASFTVVRLSSGAWALLFLSFVLKHRVLTTGPYKNLWQGLKNNANLLGGLTLFLYALCFSYAYVSMSTGTGALLLFGAVQLTMISFGLASGERFKFLQWLGFILAFAGLVILLLPSASAPPLLAGVIMVAAGMSWGVYSLLGKKSSSALLATSGNFVYATVLCFVLGVVVHFMIGFNLVLDTKGLLYAIASGVVASGCGYAIWYSALPLIKSTTAATVQLSVPVLATLMGWAVLGEQLSLQITIASVMTLGGIYLVIKN
ncbi:DMT family transporter [Alteromonas sp.]|uniref:DMT family transporter n=1 Tax=Alteromonas sp. TaxID=232 RepID=UPI00257A2BA2|nr:DMT family transporter [Alteromonas sp.]MEA3381714.1 DMT family transporter [Pseudomonadota bacterium]NQY19272.1 DMT family transporter [Alteromonas sp.]